MPTRKARTVQKAGVPPHSPMGSQVMLYDSPPISFASSMAWRWISFTPKLRTTTYCGKRPSRSFLCNPYNSDGTLNERNRYRYLKRQTEILTDVFRTCKDFIRSQGIGGDHASRLADISVAAVRTRMIEQTLAKNMQASAGPFQPTQKKDEPDDPFVTNEVLRDIMSSFLEKCEKDEVTLK